jgi:hypothetical protein
MYSIWIEVNQIVYNESRNEEIVGMFEELGDWRLLLELKQKYKAFFYQFSFEFFVIKNWK